MGVVTGSRLTVDVSRRRLPKGEDASNLTVNLFHEPRLTAISFGEGSGMVKIWGERSLASKRWVVV